MSFQKWLNTIQPTNNSNSPPVAHCPAQHAAIRKWQDYVYIQCEYKTTKQKIKHLLREENKVKENKIS